VVEVASANAPLLDLQTNGWLAISLNRNKRR